MDAPSSQPLPPASAPPPTPPPDSPLTELVNHVLEERYITQAQYETLLALVLAGGTVDEDERRQINRLFDAIHKGRVRIR